MKVFMNKGANKEGMSKNFIFGLLNDKNYYRVRDLAIRCCREKLNY